MKPYSILWLFPTLLVFAGCANQSPQSNGATTSTNSIVLDSTTSAPLPTNPNQPSIKGGNTNVNCSRSLVTSC